MVEHTHSPCLEDHPNPSMPAYKGSPLELSWPELASGSRSYQPGTVPRAKVSFL